jgi:hypothetical protein
LFYVADDDVGYLDNDRNGGHGDEYAVPGDENGGDYDEEGEDLEHDENGDEPMQE